MARDVGVNGKDVRWVEVLFSLGGGLCKRGNGLVSAQCIYVDERTCHEKKKRKA